MPTLFVFTIWDVRNKSIFKDTLPSSDLTVNLLLQKVMEHRKEIKPKPKRVLKPPRMDKNIPWAFFDGESQGEALVGGEGGILYMNEMSKTEIFFSPCQGTNNKAELSALWSVLKIATKKNVKNLQICGDSKLTIDWANGKLQINAPHLQHLLRAIKSQVERFDSLSFQHIYRELNEYADKLSKAALSLPPGIMLIKDYENNLLINQYIRL